MIHPAILRPVRRHLGGVDSLADPVRKLADAASLALWDMERDREITARSMAVLSSELEERLELVRASEEQHRTLFEVGPHPTILLRQSDKAVLRWNAAAERTLGWIRVEVLGCPLDTIGLFEVSSPLASILDGSAPRRPSEIITTSLRSRTGTIVHVELQALDMVMRGESALLLILRDVTAQLAAEQSEQESSARFRAFFDHTGIAIQVLSGDGIVLEANEACSAMLGYSPNELKGRTVASLMVDEKSGIPAACAELVSATRESVTLERQVLHRDGSAVWSQITISKVQRGREPRLMAMMQDVSERKRMEQELIRQAFQDELTGLANRALFRDRLHQALERRPRLGTEVAVLLLDLDGFKRVNDSLGHAAGDELLSVIAKRIHATVRAGDTVARLGGDEFAIVLESMHLLEDPEDLAGRLLLAIAAPMSIAGREVVVNVSIGIATASVDDDSDTVLRNADTAMYSAKNSGKQRAVVFDVSMHQHALIWLEVEQDLRRAIVHDEFEVLYQPLMRLEDGSIRGFEALLRWRHPRRGLLAPRDFLTVAEETGLIVPIGAWVLREACCRANAWGAVGDVLPSLSVNLAPRQLEHDDLIADIKVALAESQIVPSRLVLEITESQLMRAPDVARAKLQAIRELGIRVAIDDFGTGYSSLSQLQFFPVDELKIDRSFVSRLGNGDRESAFVRTMISLARSLDVEVVAEGIEYENQREILSDLGCDTGQGYLYSRPMSLRDVQAFLEKRRAPASSQYEPIDGQPDSSDAREVSTCTAS